MPNFVDPNNSIELYGDVVGTPNNTQVVSVANIEEGVLKPENGGTGVSELVPGSILSVDNLGKVAALEGIEGDIIYYQNGLFSTLNLEDKLAELNNFPLLGDIYAPRTFLISPTSEEGQIEARLIGSDDLPESLINKTLEDVVASGEFSGEANLSGEFDGNFTGDFIGTFNGDFTGDGSNITNIQLSNIDTLIDSFAETLNGGNNISVTVDGDQVLLDLQNNLVVQTISSSFIGDGSSIVNLNSDNLNNNTITINGMECALGANVSIEMPSKPSEQLFFRIDKPASFPLNCLVNLQNTASLADNNSILNSDVAGVIVSQGNDYIEIQNGGICFVSGSELCAINSKVYLGSNGLATRPDLIPDGNIYTLIGTKIAEPNIVLLNIKQIGKL